MLARAVTGPAPTLEIKLMEPGLVVGAFGSVHLVLYERDPDIESIDKAEGFQGELFRHTHGQLNLITLIKTGLSVPSPEVRRHSAKLMQVNKGQVKSAAVVIPQSGLWTSTMMSAMAGLNLLSRAPINLRLFTDRDKATRWPLKQGLMPLSWQGNLRACLDALW